MRRSKRLEKLLELFERNAELPENLEEEGRPNFLPGVEGYGYGTPVGMIPTLVATGLSLSDEPRLLATL